MFLNKHLKHVREKIYRLSKDEYNEDTSHYISLCDPASMCFSACFARIEGFLNISYGALRNKLKIKDTTNKIRKM